MRQSPPMPITTKQVVLLSIAAEAVTVAATFAVYGHDAAGAQIAARNTARVSALIFSLALAARTHRALGTSLAYGWVSAHLLHYASVVYFAVVFPKHNLRHLDAHSVSAVTGGLFLVLSLAFTTGARASWAQKLNSVVLVLIWLAFMLANSIGLLMSAHLGALGPLPALVIAMVFHLRNLRRQRAAPAMAARA